MKYEIGTKVKLGGVIVGTIVEIRDYPDSKCFPLMYIVECQNQYNGKVYRDEYAPEDFELAY